MNAMTDFEPQADVDFAEASSLPGAEAAPRKGLQAWFQDLSFKRKLHVTLGLPFTVLILGAIATYILLGQLAAELTSEAHGHSHAIDQILWLRGAISFGTVVTLALLVGGIYQIRVELTNNVVQVLDYMKRLRAREYDWATKGVERGDEFGEMARAIEQFRHAGLRLNELQAGKSQSRERQARMLRDLADRFEASVGEVVASIASASDQLQSTAGLMASTADQSSSQTDSVAHAMEEASTGVTAAAAASDEFAMSINEISRQASSSAELARQANEAAAQADGTISTLSDSASQVSQVVELIQSIAQRTNLLALNASIEAARGGEAGRGFAVVASEVKELAAQTSRATQDVARQIHDMQESTDASVAALRKVGDQISQLEATAISIASAVDQQSVAGQDLARSIDLAANGTGQVAANFAQVREASLSTGAAASQVLSSAGELGERAQQLRAQADSFLAEVRRN